MAVDTSRLRFGDLIAGGSALLLLIFMFFKWYGLEEDGEDVPEAFEDLASFSAWESFAFIDILLFLIIAAVIAIVVIRLAGVQMPQLPAPLGVIILGLGALAVLLILFRLIVVPNPEIEILGQTVNAEDGDGEVGRSFGVFLGLLAAIGIAAGGFLSAQERGEAIPGVGGPGAGAGGPLGGGQPGGPLGGGQQQPYGGGQPVGGQPVGGQPVGGQPGGGATAVGTPGVGDPGGTQVGGQAAGTGAGAQAGGSPKADWYPDPEGKARLRYWDGTQWTDQTAD